VLHKRTPEQVKEEEYLIIESRKIEQNSKRLLKDREHVIKLINTIDSAFPMKKFFPQKRAAMEAASKLAMKPPAQVESLEPLRVSIHFLLLFFLIASTTGFLQKKKRLSKTFSEDGGPSTPAHSQPPEGIDRESFFLLQFLFLFFFFFFWENSNRDLCLFC